ncbi:MAG TPA: hypothetical protein VHU90_11505 [Galbitalea sp.]|nr:hypothetical protein [Galbitalea sp.]
MARLGARGRKRRRRDGVLLQILIPIVLLIVVVVVAILVLRPSTPPPVAAPTIPACPKVPDVVIGTISVPAGPIDGYCQPELVNAAQIIRAGQSYGLTSQGEEIGVMTAIGESSLRNVNFGDTAGPDSRGLFQQRSNYGPLADRMDPYTAARAFFLRMLGIVDWQAMTPTQVAHTVQRNADPDYYTKYFPAAVRVVTELNADTIPSPIPSGFGTIPPSSG